MSFIADHLEDTPSIIWSISSEPNVEATFAAPWDGWIIARSAAHSAVHLYSVDGVILNLAKASFDRPGYPVAAGDTIVLRIPGGASRQAQRVSVDCQFVPRAAAIPEGGAGYSNTSPTARSVQDIPWVDVQVAFTSGPADPTAVKDGDVVDGVTLVPTNRFLCSATRPEAGIYVVGHTNSVRATDAAAAADFDFARTVRVREGSAGNRGRYVHKTATAITLGTTPIVFERLVASPIPPV